MSEPAPPAPRRFAVETRHRTLHGRVQVPAAPGRRPTVVICHGFKGFMDWGFFPPLADLLAERGFTVVRFNLSSSGMKPGDELVTDTAAFRTATFSQDVDEIADVLAAVGSEIAPGRADPGRLALLGHSRGGGGATLAAARPEWRDRLRALVTWAAVSTFDRQPGDVKAKWRETGTLPVSNARTGQQLELGREALDDLEARCEELDILRAAADVRCPWLIAHGEDDESVDASEARLLAERATATRDLLLVPKAGHTFGAVHPFQGPTPELIQVLNATQTWLRRHLF